MVLENTGKNEIRNKNKVLDEGDTWLKRGKS